MEQLKSSRVQIVTNARVRTTTGADPLRSIKIALTAESEAWPPPSEAGSWARAPRPTSGRRASGVELHHNRHLVVDSAMRTNVVAICSAGDITDYDARVALIAVGCGEVATAVNNAAVDIDPTLIAVPGTLHGQPGLGASAG